MSSETNTSPELTTLPLGLGPNTAFQHFLLQEGIC